MVGGEVGDMPPDPFGNPPIAIWSEDTNFRRIVHDIIPDQIIPEVYEALGMDGESEDVADAEMRGSEQRKKQIEHLGQVIGNLSHQIIHVFQAGMMVAYDLDEDEVEEKFNEEQLLRLVIPSVVSVIAQMVDYQMLIPAQVTWVNA